MAESTNEQIADALLARQLQVGRVETQQRREVWAMLLLLEHEILAALKANDPTEYALLARRKREVEALMDEEVGPLIRERYASLARLMDTFLLRLARNELTTVQDVVNDAAAAEVLRELPTDGQLRRAVLETPIPTATTPTDLSAPGAEWWTRQGEGLRQRLGDQLLVGVGLGDSLTELTARVRGTSEQAFADGIMHKAREDAARLVRTEITNAVNEAHVTLAQVNAERDVILQHSSVLDHRTGLTCLGRNGLRFQATPDHAPLGHRIPYLNGPPYHISCRSTMLTIVRSGGAVRQQSVTQWLSQRDRAFQDAVLGPTRARLWREGKLTARQLIDGLTGRPLTLEELGA